jgi:hypothetical protein
MLFILTCRMDLLRAAILGAAGTPYHDQLFMFDIQLLPDHPSRPPRVHYHSFGTRVNPNLYEDGKVGPSRGMCRITATLSAPACTSLIMAKWIPPAPFQVHAGMPLVRYLLHTPALANPNSFYDCKFLCHWPG